MVKWHSCYTNYVIKQTPIPDDALGVNMSIASELLVNHLGQTRFNNQTKRHLFICFYFVIVNETKF